MFRCFLPVIVLLYHFQGLGYCSNGLSPLQGVYSKSNPSNAMSGADRPYPIDAQAESNNNDGAAALLLHNQPKSAQQPVEKAGPAHNRRQRRHIGSIAAFRGLPGPFNKFNAAEWPLSAGRDWKKIMTPGSDFVEYVQSTDDDVIKDKRYPDVMGINNQRPNSVLIRGNPNVGVKSNKNFEILTPPHNEARARAVSRLLRLLSEARANSANVNSISKKFLGALARNNGLPTGPKATAPFVQYKGSTAIPLPGKRTSIDWGALRHPVHRSEIADTSENLQFNNQAEEYPTEDIFTDDVILGLGEDEEQTDDSDEIISNKRNIASLAAKGGWSRPSRAYNRLPHFSY
ncbi:uncharacterized protein LOC130685555 [Daphnia carinata]|uniref:uncharacterized protein LOC130685555 n=1 Tax=Daphnia carinata TaxID=120202 RepID=UPI00257C1BF2|nr:uncharacterized protein LOC130685555 [Daphnia carinata]